MKDIQEDIGLVAHCGLYCGACRSYLKGKCKGCHDNVKATWCKVRTCCQDKKIATCAACDEFKQVNECKRYNNVISKVFGLLFNSDRAACIDQIKALGLEGHAQRMTEWKQQTIKKRNKK